MKKLGTLPKDKAERKRAIRELMATSVPGAGSHAEDGGCTWGNGRNLRKGFAVS
jgi:hypothetical protein